MEQTTQDEQVHPIEAAALGKTARGTIEVPMRGGPISAVLIVEMPIAEALRYAVRVLGPDERTLMLDLARQEMERSE